MHLWMKVPEGLWELGTARSPFKTLSHLKRHIWSLVRTILMVFILVVGWWELFAPNILWMPVLIKELYLGLLRVPLWTTFVCTTATWGFVSWGVGQKCSGSKLAHKKEEHKLGSSLRSNAKDNVYTSVVFSKTICQCAESLKRGLMFSTMFAQVHQD